MINHKHKKKNSNGKVNYGDEENQTLPLIQQVRVDLKLNIYNNHNHNQGKKNQFMKKNKEDYIHYGNIEPLMSIGKKI